MMLGHRQSWPPPSLRVAYAINFPALTAAYPVQFASWSDNRVFYRRDPFIWLSVQDSVFLLAVGALWYGLGTMLDRKLGRRSSIIGSKSLAVIRLTMGSLFAVGVATLAMFYTMLTDADRPYRQIGPFGLIWAALLFWYFGSTLLVALRTFPPNKANSTGLKLP
ncbi:MAG: hypothetical protein ABSD53_14895 [Terriglobales bacterium]